MSLIAVLLSSCHVDRTKNKHCTDDTLNISFKKNYKGAIDNQFKIRMRLICADGAITGKYFYEHRGKEIKIDGYINKNNELFLNEFDNRGNQTGLFQGVYSDTLIEGIWQKPNRTQKRNFILRYQNTSKNR
jgi:hypothetical protein